MYKRQRAHFNVMAWSDDAEELKHIRNDVGSQLASMECVPRHNLSLIHIWMCIRDRYGMEQPRRTVEVQKDFVHPADVHAPQLDGFVAEPVHVHDH